MRRSSNMRLAHVFFIVVGLVSHILTVNGIVCHPTVQTSNGPIVGHSASGTPGVIEYLGIPYAEPPIGNLRFAPPTRSLNRGLYNASDWGPICPQAVPKPLVFPDLAPDAQRISDGYGTGPQTPQDEDCLKINIWTKLDWIETQADKPVIVYFHGGVFVSGSPRAPFYNGKHLVNFKDVIVVVFSYRLGFFGFPGIPDQPQNLGLRDQRLATEWIRDNIGNFGGDSSKITLFGQSAGGVAVDYWSYAYQSDPIAHAMITSSGNVFSFPNNNASVTLQNWLNVTAQVSCDSSKDILACMRALDWQVLFNASSKVAPTTNVGKIRTVPPFQPSVDEEVVFSNYLNRSSSGLFAKIPYLLGNNDHEQGLYNISAYAAGSRISPADGQDFLLRSFTCPNAFEAAARRQDGVPTWRYRYFGDWDNLRLYPGSGAYHVSDIALVLGDTEEVSGIPQSVNQVKVAETMRKAWVTFARDPWQGLSNEIGWPVYDKDQDTLIRLAYQDSPTPDVVNPDLYDALCPTVVLGALGPL